MTSPTISCDSRMDPDHIHLATNMTTSEALSHLPLGQKISRKPVNTSASPRYNGPRSQVATRKEAPGPRRIPRKDVPIAAGRYQPPSSGSHRVSESFYGPPRNTYKEKGSGCGCLIM